MYQLWPQPLRLNFLQHFLEAAQLLARKRFIGAVGGCKVREEPFNLHIRQAS
jgi:hypothetical protein